MTLSLPVYFSSRRVQLARQTLDWAILRLEGILLEKDTALALVFVGNDSVSIHLHRFVCAEQGKIMDEEMSRYVGEDRFLHKSLIVPRVEQLLSKGNPVKIVFWKFMKENDAHELTQGTNRSILRILSEPPWENIVNGSPVLVCATKLELYR